MGKGGGANIKTEVVKAEEAVTPAVARDVAANTSEAQTLQADARSRLRGIRSTYNRFAQQTDAANGAKAKLGN